MPKTNENINLPVISVPMMAAAGMTADEPGCDVMEVPPEAAPMPSCADVSVYAQTISPTSYTADDPLATFDVVFSVGIYDKDTQSTRTYQVVKRIGVDKLKLAAEAEKTSVLSVVESKATEKAPSATARRFKTLAGLE